MVFLPSNIPTAAPPLFSNTKATKGTKERELVYGLGFLTGGNRENGGEMKVHFSVSSVTSC